jgi:predicted RNase H-like HicB family nuclease
MSSYAVVLERADSGTYGAYSPDLPGCVAVGETQEETIALMREAIQAHLDGLRADGQPIPHPATVSATVVTLDAA